MRQVIITAQVLRTVISMMAGLNTEFVAFMLGVIVGAGGQGIHQRRYHAFVSAENMRYNRKKILGIRGMVGSEHSKWLSRTTEEIAQRCEDHEICASTGVPRCC